MVFKLKSKLHLADGSYNVTVNKNVINIPSTKDILNIGENLTKKETEAILVVFRSKASIQIN